MRERRLSGDDAGVSDFVATILLVALVVVIGSVVAVVVTAQLSQPAPPPASFALAPPEPGQTTVSADYRNGVPLALGELRVTLERDGSMAQVPRSAWTTPDAEQLHAGDQLTLTLDPPAVDGERLRLRVVHAPSNVVIADLPARVRTPGVGLGVATLEAAFSPEDAVPDAATATLLTARVTHPAGALAVARVEADLSNVTRAAGAPPLVVALSDDGANGDATGGDGTWSALVRVPVKTPRASYDITLNATDVSGALVGSTTLRLNVPSCHGCLAPGGQHLTEGTRLTLPTPENVTTLKLVNWNVDTRYPARVDSDTLLLRVVDGRSFWMAQLTFEEDAGVAYAIGLRVWTATDETFYEPLNETNRAKRLPLADLDLDLLRPTESLQWAVTSGSDDPLALYQNSGLSGEVTLIVAHMGHDAARNNQIPSLENGILSVDLEVR